MQQLILELFEIGAVRFGNFTLKSGMQSPIYLDLRLIPSYPELLEKVAEAMWNTLEKNRFDCVCGVPYTAIPMATAISLRHKLPMILRRKEIKEYGTKKAIEGVYEKGQNCLLVEDLATTGGSIMETVKPLELEGIVVSDAVVLIDRQQGGRDLIESNGIRFHSVLTLSEILDTLQRENKISAKTAADVTQFLLSNQPLKVN